MQGATAKIVLLLVNESSRMESAMRLSSARVQQALSQFEAQPIPDSHPAVSQLKQLFGDHTFFLDGDGLSIVEPAEPVQAAVQTAKVVKLAGWKDAERTSLMPHKAEPTDVIITLGSDNGDGSA